MPRSIKYLIGVGYFIFAGIYLPAQTVLEKDGLLHYLNLNKNDTLTVAALNKLSEYYLYKNIDSAVIYAERAEILAERFEYDAGLSEAYRNLGKVYAISGHYEKSFAYFHKAIKKNEESGDYVSLGKNYTNLGVILYYQENIEQATNYYKKALKIFSDYGYKEGLAKVYNNLGLLYADVGKTDTAIIYLHRAIKLSDITGDKNVKNNASGNLAHLLLREKDYENAVKMYLKVAESLADTEDNNLKSSVYSNIADAYLRLSDTEKDKRKAEKDLEKALMYAEKSLRKAEELNSNSLRVFSYKMLFRIYKKTGDYESAAKYSEKFIQYGDSVFNAEKTEIIAEIEAEYNNKKKQLLIENLRKEKESDLKLIKRKNQIIYITEAGLLLVTVLSLFLFILYKGKKRALKLLDEKNKAITAQREEIAAQRDKISEIAFELKKANRTKNKLFSIIAHDLKNPFQGIIGFSELIIKEAEKQSSEKIKKYSQYIYDVSLQSYKLLDNLLDFTRSQTGLIKYNPEYFNIAEPVKETVLLVKSNADAKGVNLIDEVTENSEELKVFADKSMIATVLRNLISNAVKFTPSGGTVRISAKLEDDNLILKVADTGVGIKESDIPKLFKADLNFSTFGTRNEKGTGLGLVVCKDFIDKNNGTISVKSKVGKGSVFTITLPVKK